MKKSTKILRCVAVISVIFTILGIIWRIILPLILQYVLKQKSMADINGAAVIGIIGGADGPTQIIVSKGNGILYNDIFFAFCFLTALISTVTLLVKKRKN